MPSITNSNLTQKTSKSLCYYFNPTSEIQLIRLWNSESYSLEKIIFPRQRFLFEAKPEGILEVHTKQENKRLLSEIFSCLHLQV